MDASSRRSPTTRSRRLARRLLLPLLGAAAGLASGELLLRRFLPEPGFRAQSPGITFEFNARSAPGVRGPAVFHVNSMGVRGREWSLDRASECRVLCLGGSTTECLMTDQSRVWTTLLEQELQTLDGRRVWVGNAGKSSISADEHVLQTTHLLDVYDPDVVTLLVGVNDLCQALFRGTSYDPAVLESPERRRHLLEQAFSVFPDSSLPDGARDSWWRSTRTWMLLRKWKLSLKAGEFMDAGFNNLVAWRARRAAGTRSNVLPDLGPALDHYGRNLREIVARARAHRVPLVLITQPVLWRADLTDEEKGLLWMGGVEHFVRETGLYYEPGALALGMDAFNEKLRDVCAQTGTTCLDLAGVVAKTTDNFFDDCHFTDRAQPLIAHAVAELLRRLHPGERRR